MVSIPIIPHSYVTKDCSTRVPIQIDSVYCCNRYGIILHEREQLEQVAHPQAFTTVDLKCQLNSPQPTEISLQSPQTWWLYWRVPFTAGFNSSWGCCWVALDLPWAEAQQRPRLTLPDQTREDLGSRCSDHLWSEFPDLVHDNFSNPWKWILSREWSKWGWVKTLVPSEPQNSW